MQDMREIEHAAKTIMWELIWFSVLNGVRLALENMESIEQ